MRLTLWFNDDFKKFCKWNKKVSSKNAFLKFIQNLFTYVERYEVCASLYFAEWKLLLESLMATKFIYCVMDACIEFKLKTTGN